MNFSIAAAAILLAPTALVSGLAPVFTPDSTKFAYGLPGAPFTTDYNFDPLGLAEGKDYEPMKQYREAELQHGRVAMLGAFWVCLLQKNLSNSIHCLKPTSRILVLPSVIWTKYVPHHLFSLKYWLSL